MKELESRLNDIKKLRKEETENKITQIVSKLRALIGTEFVKGFEKEICVANSCVKCKSYEDKIAMISLKFGGGCLLGCEDSKRNWSYDLSGFKISQNCPYAINIKTDKIDNAIMNSYKNIATILEPNIKWKEDN